MSKKKVIFVLSVDTEEEFDWDGVFPQQECSVRNIQELPKFQEFCDQVGIRPTYLIDYPVATVPESASIIRSLNKNNSVEIGAHLHPWCTPPFEGANTDKESHVINLSPELVTKKLTVLLDAIKQNIGIEPKVFRTGRWGINSDVMKIVSDANFEIDSSIYPFYENDYFSCKSAPHTPYWPSLDNPDIPGSQRKVMEIPVTAGFNHSNFSFWSSVHNILSSKWLKPFRLIGLSWQTKLLRKLYLSPELSSTEDLISLIKASLDADNSVIHMYLHSSTLLTGKNMFTQNINDTQVIYDRMQAAITFLASQAEIEFATLSEAKSLITSNINHSLL